jgi:hypothetical protein
MFVRPSDRGHVILARALMICWLACIAHIMHHARLMRRHAHGALEGGVEDFTQGRMRVDLQRFIKQNTESITTSVIYSASYCSAHKYWRCIVLIIMVGRQFLPS